MLAHGISLETVKKYIDPEAIDDDGQVLLKNAEGYFICMVALS